jgi:hypothetical protein
MVLICVRGWVDPQDNSKVGRIKSMKKSNDTSRNRICDLPAFRAVSKPTLPLSLSYVKTSSWTPCQKHSNYLLSRQQTWNTERGHAEFRSSMSLMCNDGVTCRNRHSADMQLLWSVQENLMQAWCTSNVVRESSVKFGLHSGNTKWNTKYAYELWM